MMNPSTAHQGYNAIAPIHSLAQQHPDSILLDSLDKQVVSHDMLCKPQRSCLPKMSMLHSVLLSSVAVAVFSYGYHLSANQSHSATTALTMATVSASGTTDKSPPHWQWDHNIYIPSTHDQQVNQVNQLSPTLILHAVADESLESVADISALSNRAYAKKWMMDYARYTSINEATANSGYFFATNRAGASDTEDTHTALLARILSWQYALSSTHDDDDVSAQRFNLIQYDRIIILPADSIIAQLDQDIIREMLPNQTLLAIATANHVHADVTSSSYLQSSKAEDEETRISKAFKSSASKVVVYNLNSPIGRSVAEKWQHLSSKNDDKKYSRTTASVQQLLNAISDVIPSGKRLSDFVNILSESKDGFLGTAQRKRLIKSISNNASTRSLFQTSKDIAKSSESLVQQTVDAVCYRFYPSCELVECEQQ